MDLEEEKEEIFAAAIEFEDRAERNAYLARVCGEDQDLFEKVQGLLRRHDASSFLDMPPLAMAIDIEIATVTETPGTIIGRYKLLERIGEGGMAVVHMAEQEQPIRRKVALKVIKLGMDTKQVIARFEAERQALALMDHPNIARVLDAGATETGRPYFVMELVTGVSITEYCDKNNLSTKDRLGLFIQVCHAVQHAHQKGIIHRDLIPSNVMVAHHDGKPVPKVIDFGIAKATNQRLTEKTLFTRYAHIIGTPAYMSPEQAELSDLDIDTRSDIYSLGVLLYELLTGTPPFSEEELHKAGYLEMQRIIREEEPTKPSTKLSTLGETLTDVAKHHGSTPDLLRKAIRGDLDWIVMKSLEKDRVRRYETANALAMDVQRHLEHEPVLARGPSTVYRLQKFLRRNRVPAVAVLAIAVVVAAMAIILSMWNRDRLQLAEAEGLRQEAERLMHKSILSQAREHVAKADYAAALDSVKSILRSKHVGPEAQLLYAGILAEGREPNEAVARLESLLDERPEIAGAAHALLARIYWEGELGAAGRLTKANEHRQTAEELLPETAEAYFLRALTAATIKETFSYLNKALDIDPAHYESRRLRAYTYHCSRNFSSAAEDALCLVMLRPQDPLGHALRADALRQLDRYEEAINSYNKAIECTSSEDPQLVDLYDHRRETYIQMGSFQEALLDAKKCVSLAEEKEIYHIHVFTALVSLGLYEEAKAKYSELYDSLPQPNTDFWAWCAEYVFDTLEASGELNLPKTDPVEPAFLPMLETEKIYRDLKAKGRRLITGGWWASWSPDGTKLAYSKGVWGASGIAVYDLRSQQTELLFVPGRDPAYSPDGQYIAFVRDRQILPLDELATGWEHQLPREGQEVWLMRADGSESRRLARGGEPHWSTDSKRVFYLSFSEKMLYSIPAADADVGPAPVFAWSTYHPTLSPDSQYIAYPEGKVLTISDLSSRAIVSRWVAPMPMAVEPPWAPNGPQFHMPPYDQRIGVGLWIYDFEHNDVTKILTAPKRAEASWSPDKKRLAVSVAPPFYDIWILDTDSLSPGQTLQEHLRERAEFYERLAQADPCNADRHLLQAAYYQYLADPNSLFSGQKRYAEFFFGEPTNLGWPVNTSSGDIAPFISADGLSLYFASTRAGGGGGYDLWLSTRDTIDDEWGPCTNLGPTVNTSSGESSPRISADGLSLYFDSDRGGGYGGWDLWMTTRETTSDPRVRWGEPVNLGPTVNSPADEACPSTSADGLELYFGEWMVARPGGYGSADLWVTKRPTKDDPWGTPVNLGDTVNSSYPEVWPFISADGLKLYFSSTRAGGYGSSDSSDIWVTTRASTDSPWTKPVNLGPTVNSPFDEGLPSLSANGSTLYFGSDRPGGSGHWDLWQAPVPHWPDDIEASGGTDPADMLPQSDEGEEVVPDATH